jgi:hypothetical protein
MINAKRQRQALIDREYEAAVLALEAVDPDTSDETIAGLIADYLAVMNPKPLIHVGIIHDVRPSTLARLDRLRKADFQPTEPAGPCPVAYDWHSINTVGISTRDETRARAWTITATLAGYNVFRKATRHAAGFSPGPIADIRQRAARRR